jgi:RNase P subunit RPR2
MPASDDASSKEAARSQTNFKQRHCGKCQAAMDLIAAVAKLDNQPGCRIFSCSECGTIDWVQW